MIAVFLAGCQQEQSVDYFLENPKELKSAIQRCEQANGQSMRCRNAEQAGRIFFDLIDKRSQNPEKFGLQIMQAEQQLVSQKNLVEQYKAEHNPKLSAAMTDYQNQFHTVKVLLAVVAAMDHVE